jgi:hypothetical protein
VVHPVDQVAAGMLPDLPTNVIIIKAHINRPGLDPFKVDQHLFSLVDRSFDFFVLAVEIG